MAFVRRDTSEVQQAAVTRPGAPGLSQLIVSWVCQGMWATGMISEQ